METSIVTTGVPGGIDDLKNHPLSEELPLSILAIQIDAQSRLSEIQRNNYLECQKNIDLLDSPPGHIDALSYSDLLACFVRSIEKHGSFTDIMAERLDQVFQAKLIRLLRTPDTTKENLISLDSCIARINRDAYRSELKLPSCDYPERWKMIRDQISMAIRILEIELERKNS